LHLLSQHLAPHQTISKLAWFLAENKNPWLKNYLINYFIKRHNVNMQEAIQTDPFAYASFNEFFTRKLKSTVRPIAIDPMQIISPADGTVAEAGKIEVNQIIQAKSHSFSISDLLGGSSIDSSHFINGNFCTIYLAPHDYHRVHMPIDGNLEQMLFIPGKLFSVSTQTSELIPNLFARNERLVTIFDTQIGKVAIILVGAMIVGSIETSWEKHISPPHNKHIRNWNYDHEIKLTKGQDLGLFKLGSTVITLLPNNKVILNKNITRGEKILMGQSIASII
jgi:phosphatidylserine decarboxylase